MTPSCLTLFSFVTPTNVHRNSRDIRRVISNLERYDWCEFVPTVFKSLATMKKLTMLFNDEKPSQLSRTTERHSVQVLWAASELHTSFFPLTASKSCWLMDKNKVIILPLPPSQQNRQRNSMLLKHSGEKVTHVSGDGESSCNSLSLKSASSFFL